jgi:hypothetical protein
MMIIKNTTDPIDFIPFPNILKDEDKINCATQVFSKRLRLRVDAACEKRMDFNKYCL